MRPQPERPRSNVRVEARHSLKLQQVSTQQVSSAKAGWHSIGSKIPYEQQEYQHL